MSAPAPDGGSGHYVSGNCLHRHSDRAVVDTFESHWKAVEALLAMPAELKRRT